MATLASDIENERKQAQTFALQAANLEELGLSKLAKVFRELVELCDLKVEAFQQLDGPERPGLPAAVAVREQLVART